jgi:hypothetical protein
LNISEQEKGWNGLVQDLITHKADMLVILIRNLFNDYAHFQITFGPWEFGLYLGIKLGYWVSSRLILFAQVCHRIQAEQ